MGKNYVYFIIMSTGFSGTRRSVWTCLPILFCLFMLRIADTLAQESPGLGLSFLPGLSALPPGSRHCRAGTAGPAEPGRQSRAGSLSLTEKCATCPAWPGRRPRRGTSLRATGSARLGVDWNFQSGSPHQSQISSTSHWKASVRFSPSLPAREVTARNSSPRNLRREVLSSPEVFPSKTHR